MERTYFYFYFSVFVSSMLHVNLSALRRGMTGLSSSQSSSDLKSVFMTSVIEVSLDEKLPFIPHFPHFYST